MTFALSQQSQEKLYGVHPDLVRVVKRAILVTTEDFAVTEGVRTTAEEAEHVANGTSHTMNSKHLVQSDGYGHASDLVPWVNGALVWALPAAVQWKFIYPVAAAVQEAAIAESVRLRWGGCWDKVFNDIAAGADALQAAVVEYCTRHPGPDFLDGPHFELAP